MATGQLFPDNFLNLTNCYKGGVCGFHTKTGGRVSPAARDEPVVNKGLTQLAGQTFFDQGDAFLNPVKRDEPTKARAL